MVKEKSLDEKTEFDDLLKEVEITDSERTSKKRRKRKKAETETIPSFVNEDLKPFIRFPFNFLAKRFGEHWKLEEEEEKSLIELSNRVVNKWLPTWLTKFSDEIALCGYLVILLLPRIEETKRIQKLQKEKSSETKIDETKRIQKLQKTKSSETMAESE